jgi:hypothetical protein
MKIRSCQRTIWHSQTDGKNFSYSLADFLGLILETIL